MLSRAQFASVVGSGEKWVENTARLLDRPLAYTVDEARWMRLVHVLAKDFAIAIPSAARFAAAVVDAPAARGDAVLARSTDEDATLVLDLARFNSGFIAALSAALLHRGKRQAGRLARRARGSTTDRLQAASHHGVDISLVKAALRLTPAERLARLEANAESLRALRRGTTATTATTAPTR